MLEKPNDLYLHADGDSFFVSCEVAQMPEYKGKPVVVGEDAGIAVAMSYEAKTLGVTRGMPTFQIKREFPSVILLPHHFDLYNKISNEVYKILISYLSVVEVYSIDECFAKVSKADIKYAGGPDKLVNTIKDEIQNKLGVTYSFGLAHTKALAKTASKLNKPNGTALLLKKEDEINALKNTPIDDVWGIGRQTIPRLQNMGMKTAYDFAYTLDEDIKKYFSESLWDLKRELSGEIVNDVHMDTDPRDQKSIQSTSTYRPASSDPSIIFAELSTNTERACENARELELVTKSVSFFVKNKEFVHRFGDSTLPLYTNDPSLILNAIEPIFMQTIKKGEEIRSTGITLKNLRRAEDVQKDLFGVQESADDKNIINIVGDKIRQKFGNNILKRASSLRGHNRNRGNTFPK
jgi:nucleotidyltransferase/DNA polymerase involved in DNA repair